ncbi:MAG: heme-copper oxidase subunit III [Ktedonobacteraceae bacterium]|nr:heme-copper oxidase subunit III [Ktedonobacteraceae bacterium]
MSTAHGEQVRILEEHSDVGRGLNWWGMVFFIASEALIFANLIAAFLYLEIRNPAKAWLLPSGDHLNWLYALVATAILVASSGPIRFAGRGIAKGNKRNLVLGLIGTIILGAVFLGLQVNEYVTLYFSDHFSIQHDVFGSAFFTLTGFHGLHVTIGLIFLIVCLVRAIRGDFTDKKHFAVEAGEMYWHFVDIVWIFVFSIVYLLPLLRG